MKPRAFQTSFEWGCQMLVELLTLPESLSVALGKFQAQTLSTPNY